MRIVLKVIPLIVILLMSLTGCLGFFSAEEPAEPTSSVQFITPTPATGGGASPTISPTPIAAFPTNTPAASPTITPTPSETPTPTQTPTVTPTPNLTPHAVIDSPSGVLNVRNGPGEVYDPPVGSYENGAVVDVVGQQYDASGNRWWVINFPSSWNKQGWVYADFTEAQNVADMPLVTAPPTPTPFIPTPVATEVPSVVIDSPVGFVQVKRGPGENYDPPWGAYNNGANVKIVGKQYSAQGELWWLIPFNISPTGQGWIKAQYTINPNNISAVPWVNVPLPAQPIPIDTPTYGTPQPTPIQPAPIIPTPIYNTPPPNATPYNPIVVDWAIAGRVVDVVNGQPLAFARIEARLGTDDVTETATTDADGTFSILGRARDAGDLFLFIRVTGYAEQVLSAGPTTPRNYYFADIAMTPLTAGSGNLVTWTASGRVTELGTGNPLAQATVEAILGINEVRLTTTTDLAGEFTISGQATDSGVLKLNLNATGYQPTSYVLDPTNPRRYNLPDLQMAPSATTCLYENVVELPQNWAMARLRTLGFTNINSEPVLVNDNAQIDYVISQLPPPPDVDESESLPCDTLIILRIGTTDVQ